jgi:hypothetical protein
MSNPEEPSTVQVALSTIVPFILGLCVTRVTMVIGERYGSDTMPFILVGWCAALGASTAWLNRVVFRRIKTIFPFLVAVVVILLVWLWQRYAFTILVPYSGLTYGYLLRPEGAKAGFWTLTLPFSTGLAGSTNLDGVRSSHIQRVSSCRSTQSHSDPQKIDARLKNADRVWSRHFRTRLSREHPFVERRLRLRSGGAGLPN